VYGVGVYTVATACECELNVQLLVVQNVVSEAQPLTRVFKFSYN